MTAINNVNSSVPFGERKRESGGMGIGVPITTTLIGGGIGYGLTRQPKEDEFKAMVKANEVKLKEGELSDTEKAQVAEAKAEIETAEKTGATNSSTSDTKPNATEAKNETKEAETAKSEPKADAKPTTPKSVASKRELEEIFKGTEELPYDKYLQKKYGVSTVGALMDRCQRKVQALNHKSGGIAIRKAGNVAKHDANNIATGIQKAQAIIAQKQQVAIAELNVREAQINFQYAAEGNRDIAKSELETARKALAEKQKNLGRTQTAFDKLAVDSDGKLKPGFDEIKDALDGKINLELPSEKVFKSSLDTAIGNKLQAAGQEAPGKFKAKSELGNLETTTRADVLAEVEKQAESDAKNLISAGKKPKDIEKVEFIKQTKSNAVLAQQEMINKRVKLALDRRIQEIKGKETEAFLSRFNGIISQVDRQAQKQAGKVLSHMNASVTEMKGDIALAQEAKKSGKPITKTQSEEVIQKASDELKTAMGKVKEGLKGKAKDAPKVDGEGVAKILPKTAELYKNIGEKLAKVRTWKRGLVGAAIGLGAGIIIKWIFGGKSEEQA